MEGLREADVRGAYPFCAALDRDLPFLLLLSVVLSRLAFPIDTGLHLAIQYVRQSLCVVIRVAT